MNGGEGWWGGGVAGTELGEVERGELWSGHSARDKSLLAIIRAKKIGSSRTEKLKRKSNKLFSIDIYTLQGKNT